MARRPPSSAALEASFVDFRTSSSSEDQRGAPSTIVRKADLAYNHVQFTDRPGECKIFKKKLDVLCNYFKLHAPSRLQAHSYRIELSTKGRNGFEPVLKREKAEPLFWSLYQQHRHLFPRSLNRLVFDGVGTIYSLEPLDIRAGTRTVEFLVNPPTQQTQTRGGGGQQRAPPKAKANIIVLPMFAVDDFFTIDESVRTQMVQLLDLIISQEMRCPLVQNASRFVQQGHSLFKVPVTDAEKRMCVRPIGMGEEVWTGLHMAIKADAPQQLYVNANTSTSIFYSANLNLVDFYAQVIHGYDLDHSSIDGDDVMMAPGKTRELAAILKGTKVRILMANGTWKVKKFDDITKHSADSLTFNCEGRGVMSVAQYFCQVRQHRLKYPKLPCLSFMNKSTGTPAYFPIEVCTTGEEPRRFKGKLTDRQLDTFIKAAGMGPRQKRELIETLTATQGSYLGDGALMREWGVEVDRKMVEIKEATVLRYPDIQWHDRVSIVNEISAEYNITENDKEPRKMIETGKPVAVVMVYVNGDGCKQVFDPQNELDMTREQLNARQQQIYQRSYRENSEFFVAVLRKFGMDVLGPAWTFQYLLDERGKMNISGINGMIEHFMKEIAEAGAAQKKEFVPLFVFIFPRRHQKLHACLKYKCDIQYGVLSQILLSRTFKKFTGNPVSNSSGQNVFLKVLAKAGGVACRVDGNQFKNVGKMTRTDEPTLVLGIDVSHPSREERIAALGKYGLTPDQARAANQNRGKHEQLSTAQKASSNRFEGFSFHDCPRSVVAVVGNCDINQTKWGTSSRVQRLGQEESVNLTEPFFQRIKDFHSKTGVLPRHIIVYRDGVSDSQFKKVLYEETQALERALEQCSLSLDQVTITYIVAKKRNHTRFFASDPQQAVDLAGRPGGNTPPGLLIENTITSRHHFDFFIQSHYGNIGTAAPTHYSVLRDDWKPSQSFWQTVVFAHTFGNSRSTRPLSIPVPLHYAHLAAKRAKNNFDHFRDVEAPDEYANSTEDLVRESMETEAISPNEALRNIDSMYFA